MVITLSYINKLIMKVLKYSLFLFFIFFISCNSNKEENLAIKKIPEATARVKTEKFKLVISYIGATDYRILSLIFEDSCKERFEVMDCHLMLKYTAYLELKELIQNPNYANANYSQSVLVMINNKKKYQLSQRHSIIFIYKLLSLTAYKNSELLNSALNDYIMILKE
jgi:hypothetical protein